MPNVHSNVLQEFVAEIFKTEQVSAIAAERVSKSLVKSNLSGHDSHGVVRVFQYLKGMRQGELDPDATPSVALDLNILTLVDGGHGFGQLAAHKAISIAIEKAQAQGLSAAGIYKCGHVGRLGEWVEMAAHEGLIGLGFSNGGIPGGIVAPYGGSEPALGTNPIAAAFPVDGGEPVLIDFASSLVAEGKVRIARTEGELLPQGWVLDKRGQPTINPEALYDGGMLLPAAGHKGYALSLLVEFLGGVLTGAGCAILPGFTPGNGIFFIVISASVFRARVDFERDGAELVKRLKAIRPAPGFEEVLVPGEPEHRMERKRLENGIPLDDSVWEELEAVATSGGMDVPADLFVEGEG